MRPDMHLRGLVTVTVGVPKPCIDHDRCRRLRVWRVTSPADLLHTRPANVDRDHASSHTCDHHLSETVRWARENGDTTVEIVPLKPRPAGRL
jgi:hypothetical protein